MGSNPIERAYHVSGVHDLPGSSVRVHHGLQRRARREVSGSAVGAVAKEASCVGQRGALGQNNCRYVPEATWHTGCAPSAVAVVAVVVVAAAAAAAAAARRTQPGFAEAPGEERWGARSARFLKHLEASFKNIGRA